MARLKRFDRISVGVPLGRACLNLDDVRKFVEETAHISGTRKVLNMQYQISIDLEDGE